jgi:tetratricopeptide (TPR) repeat protein
MNEIMGTRIPRLKLSLYPKAIRWVAVLLGLSGLCLSYSQIVKSIDARKIKAAYVLLERNQKKEALDLLKPMQKKMVGHDDYWYICGIAMSHLGKHSLAIKQFEKAAQFSSDPDLFLKMSHCYLNLGNYTEAVKCCSTAINIVPNRMYPRYTLMRIFQIKKDTLQIIKAAEALLAQVPKGVSQEAPFFKSAAKTLIDSLKILTANNLK